MNYQVNTKDDQAYQSLMLESKKFNRIGWIIISIVIVVALIIGLIGNVKGIKADLIGIAMFIPGAYFILLSERKESKARKLVIQPEFPAYQMDEEYFRKTKKVYNFFTWFSLIGMTLFLGYSAMDSIFEFNPLKLPTMYVFVIGCLFAIIGILTAISEDYLNKLRNQYLKYHQGDQEK